MDTDPPLRFLTGSLKVEYLRPTPLDGALELRGRVKEVKGRKVVVAVTVFAQGQMRVRGEVVAIQMPEHLMPDSR
jgi:acyl-CoA thioesterase FadM